MNGSKVGHGYCQPNDGSIVWNLKPMDGTGVDFIGKDSSEFAGHTFAVEVCEPPFKTAEMKPYTAGETEFSVAGTGTLNEGNAYWTTTTEGSTEYTPTYSFTSGYFVPSVNSETGKWTGWDLKYVSNENCADKDPAQPFVMTIHGICDPKGTDAGVWSGHTFDGECSASVTNTGKSGCVFFNGRAVWKAVEPFTGFILIAVGAVMIFAGAKFLFQLFAAVCNLVCTIVFYLLISNLFFQP